MLVANYVREKIKKSSHMDKAKDMSIGHNKLLKVNVEISSMLLISNEDGLVEIEVKSGKDLGWIYREDIEFFILEKNKTMFMTNFNSVKIMVEACAKKYGKMYSEKPEAYHVTKNECGQSFYYLKEEDIIDLHNVGV